jgi:hypothetical protein
VIKVDLQLMHVKYSAGNPVASTLPPDHPEIQLRSPVLWPEPSFCCPLSAENIGWESEDGVGKLGPLLTGMAPPQFTWGPAGGLPPYFVDSSLECELPAFSSLSLPGSLKVPTG